MHRIFLAAPGVTDCIFWGVAFFYLTSFKERVLRHHHNLRWLLRKDKSTNINKLLRKAGARQGEASAEDTIWEGSLEKLAWNTPVLELWGKCALQSKKTHLRYFPRFWNCEIFYTDFLRKLIKVIIYNKKMLEKNINNDIVADYLEILRTWKDFSLNLQFKVFKQFF